MTQWEKGYEYNTNGQYDSALLMYFEALRNSPDDYNSSRIKLNIGALLQRNHVYDQALKYYKDAADGFAEHPKFLGDCFRNMGQIYSLHGKHDLAETYIIKAKQLYTTNEDIYLALNSLGVSYKRAEKYENAVKTYMRARAYGGEDKWTYNNIGHAYQLAGNFDSSYYYLHKSLKLESRQNVLNNLAMLFSDHNKDSANFYAYAALNDGKENNYSYEILEKAADSLEEKVKYQDQKIKDLEYKIEQKNQFKKEEAEYYLLYLVEREKNEAREREQFWLYFSIYTSITLIVLMVLRAIQKYFRIKRIVKTGEFKL